MNIGRVKESIDEMGWRGILRKTAVVLAVLLMVLWIPATILNVAL